MDQGAFTWDASLATGVQEIDNQHQALLQAYRDLDALVSSGRAREDRGQTLLYLTQYTVHHFRAEEALMEKAAYPDLARHRKLHHDMVVSLSELMKDYMKGSQALTHSTLSFLGGWLVEHILGEDQRFAEFLRA